jgi:WD40 repeat protein
MLLIYETSSIQSAPRKSFMACGDSKILLVDYIGSNDTNPKIIWEWDAHNDTALPEPYRTTLFDTVDDCKSTNNGQQILVSSSSGAVAIIDTESKQTKFYTRVPNGHSVELLPDNRLIAASSLSTEGNKLMLFDITKSDSKPLFTVPLESAHGVVWDRKRNSLYALGYNISREYKMISADVLRLNKEWTIKGIDGHDLQMVPGGDALFMTEETGAWKFNLTDYTFGKIEGFPDAANIKSLGQDNSFQYIYTIEEEGYWTYHVRFFNPIRVFTFPTLHVYKARWFNVTLSSSSIAD